MSKSLIIEKPRGESITYYFIAIHNEPRIEDLEINYQALEELVAKANKYNMKLTLMFTPQWADFIVNNSGRAADLKQWEKQDYEIAAHHHCIRHRGVWDGYTCLPKEEALQIRRRIGRNETYLGDMKDYISELKKLNPDIHSGCLNDEGDKNILPDEIIYDTCSGYVNFGEPWSIRMLPRNAELGRNEFVSVGIVKGVERRWLNHSLIMDDETLENAKQAYSSMRLGVYGVVTHSVKIQAEKMIKFMDFLHSRDPKGEKCKTLSEMIESKLLPEKQIDPYK